MAGYSTQFVLPALTGGPAPVRATQLTLGWLGALTPLLRVTRIDLGALTLLSPVVLMTRLAVDVLHWTEGVTMPPVFPTLPGLGYSVIKRPRWFNGLATSASGREVRVGYAASPLWEFDLTWDYLPDQQTATSATASDLKTLMGFCLAQSGSLTGFLFADPDDDTVTNQPVGVGDGSTAVFTLFRTYGGSDGTGSEPIGYLNMASPFAVFLDGVLADPSSYQVLGTTPVAQLVRFLAAPAAGAVIAVTMSYYFYVRLKDDTYEFEKFMDKLWSQRLITLTSLRG